ncbi:MAG: Hpt domain-containing protein [Bacilli bacterium]
MNRISCIKAGIDYDEGLQRCMDSEEFYHEFLKKFLEDDSYSNLLKAMAAKDATAAFAAAHTLKGVILFLSLKDLSNALNPVVEGLRNATVIDAAVPFMPKLEEEYKRVTDFLREME